MEQYMTCSNTPVWYGCVAILLEYSLSVLRQWDLARLWPNSTTSTKIAPHILAHTWLRSEFLISVFFVHCKLRVIFSNDISTWFGCWCLRTFWFENMSNPMMRQRANIEARHFAYMPYTDTLDQVETIPAFALRWRHNDHAGVSNHQPHGCLLNRLFRRKSKKTSKLRVTGLCAGNSPGTGGFPAQNCQYAENVSIWWRHHADVRTDEAIFHRFHLSIKPTVLNLRMSCVDLTQS